MTEVLNKTGVQDIIVESTAIPISIPKTSFSVQIPTRLLQSLIEEELSKRTPDAIGKLS